MTDKMKLEESVEFAMNPEPRCACVLLLDTSGSMLNEPINALNEGLKAFKDDLIKDPLASKRVEVAVVSFNNEVTVIQDFVTADDFEPPTLTAQGLTFMGIAINEALDMVEARKAQYRANSIAYYRPWIFMITDGEPQGEPEDAIQRASQRVKTDEANGRVAFFAVGVQTANMEKLKTISVREPVKLIGLNFVKMFLWLSKSTQAVSHSKLDQQVPLPPPTGWGIV
jgi:uncharacterized protein YegL